MYNNHNYKSSNYNMEHLESIKNEDYLNVKVERNKLQCKKEREPEKNFVEAFY